MKKIFDRIYLIAIANLFLPLIVRADTIAANLPDVELDEVIDKIIGYFLGAVIIAAVFMIVWAGFNFVTAGGDQEKISKAKKTIFGAIIGLIIALLAQVFVELVLGVVE